MRAAMTPEGDLTGPAGPGAALEANLDWIRSLARALARDPEAAEDLAQATCVAALEAPADGARRFRPWIATVMKNLWRQRGRSEERRRAREESARRPDRTSDDLVLEVVLFRELAQHVLELDEPYRSAVLMRFWGRLPPRAIAARLSTTPATVQNRIARGLAILRRRLDRSRGGRAAWLAAFGPWIARPFPWTASTLGGIALNTKIVVAVAALVAVGALVALGTIESRSEKSALAAGPPAASAPIPAEDAEPSQAGTGGAEAYAERAPAAAVPTREGARDAAAEPALPASFRVRGRVLDAAGAPLPGLAIRAESGGPILAKSGDGGWFDLESGVESARCVSADPAWTTVRSAVLRRSAKIEPLLLVARALDVQGTVEDAHGEPLPSARVRLELPAGFETRFDRPLEASIGLDWATVSGPDGAFALHGLPSIEGARLSAVLEGYARGTADEPVFGDAHVVIVMQPPPTPPAGSLRGRVVDDVGRPVAKGTRLPRPRLGRDRRPRRVRPRLRARGDDGPHRRGGGRMAPGDPRPAARAARGGHGLAALGRARAPRARSSRSRGRSSTRTATRSPACASRSAIRARWGPWGMMPAHAEFLASGAPIPPQALETESRMPEEDGDSFHDLTMTVGPASAFFHYVTTDARGRFELGGLDDRRYRIELADPKTCSRTSAGEHRAGVPPVELHWSPAPLLPSIAGKVLGETGEPVAGVRVELTRRAFGAAGRVFGGRVDVALFDQRERATSDENGAFEFHGVPSEGIIVNVSGEGILSEAFPLEGAGPPGALELRVHQRCSFEVVVSTPDVEGDEIELLDGEGEPLDVLRIDSEHTNAWTSAPLVEGRTGVLSASSAARQLRLLQDGAPVKTIPIRLNAGEVTRIEL
jgi:RNA polymerase sigma factor (sigma-70 family)